MNLFLTFFVALAGGLLMFRLKVPGGMMVGAIVSVMLLSIFSGLASMPGQAKVAAQCLAGAFIACGVDRSDLKNIMKLRKPLLVLLASLLAVNLTLGLLIWLCSPMDMLTSLMCAVPGGMSDTPIIAADLGADAGKVAILQFVRMSTGIGLFPSLILCLSRNEEQAAASPGQGGSAGGEKAPYRTSAFLATLAAAFVCGVAGKLSGVPAGTLVFSMFGVIALKLLTGCACLPMYAKRLAQALSGAYIGCGITRADLLELKYLILPAVLILAGYFLNSVLTGRLLRKLFGFPLRSAMLIATPAGASDMALISSDLGVESKEVIELQIIRMVLVISIFPQIIAAISRLFQ